MENVYGDGLQMRLDATASKLSGVCNSLTAAREQLERQCGSSTASHLQLALLLSSSGFCFVHGVDRLVNEEIAAHRVWITGVVALASDSLELDLRSIVELLRTVEQRGRVCTAKSRRLKRLFTCLWFLETTDQKVNHEYALSTTVIFSI